MRFIKTIISSLTLLFVSSKLWAHSNAEELGHHWDIPAYRLEMRFQIHLMGIAACVILIALWMRQIFRKKGV